MGRGKRSACRCLDQMTSGFTDRSAMDIETYRQLDAVGIAQCVRRGEASASDIVECALAVIAAANPQLNAVVLVDPDRARSAAAAVDPSCPLAGVPVLIKDNNLFVDGWPTTFSCTLYEGSSPCPDSTFVGRLRRAGAVLVGKTNTPEFASDWTTEPTLRGPTRNPWNLERSAGGSSGGSAAAVASGMVPAAHGNDNAGSIRVPAAVCGLFGLKPTRGLVPIGPTFPELAAGLDSEHMLTRSVRDSAAFLDCLADPEPGGQYRVERSVPSYLAALDQPLTGLRIGYVTTRPDGSSVDPEIASALERVAGHLREMGHSLVPMALPHDPQMGLEAEKIGFAEIALLVRQRARELGRDARSDEIEAITALAIERVRGLDAVAYLEARHKLHRIGAALAKQMEAFDAILTPTTGETAPLIGELDTRTAHFDYDRWCAQGVRFAPFTDLFNVTGQPAASVPAGLSRAGLPIGVQIAAAPGRDELVLQLCARIETALALPLAERRSQ